MPPSGYPTNPNYKAMKEFVLDYSSQFRKRGDLLTSMGSNSRWNRVIYVMSCAGFAVLLIFGIWISGPPREKTVVRLAEPEGGDAYPPPTPAAQETTLSETSQTNSTQVVTNISLPQDTGVVQGQGATKAQESTQENAAADQQQAQVG